jgi:hypothetical protein
LWWRTKKRHDEDGYKPYSNWSWRMEAASFKTNDGEVTFNTMHQCFFAWDGLCQEPRGLRISRDIRPTISEGKSFWFVPEPSPKHYARTGWAKTIKCNDVKYLKVPSPSYGIVYIVHTPGSITKQQLYKVTIGDAHVLTSYVWRQVHLGLERRSEFVANTFTSFYNNSWVQLSMISLCIV